MVGRERQWSGKPPLPLPRAPQPLKQLRLVLQPLLHPGNSYEVEARLNDMNWANILMENSD